MMLIIALSLLLVSANALECQLACTFDLDPICGSDGLTYSNLCELNARNCLTKSNVKVFRAGECPMTKMEEKEECLIRCQRINNPVCGTDGITYMNPCELKSNACLKKSSLQIAQVGECREEEQVFSNSCDIPCQFLHEPVCGNDGKTYQNKCFLQTQSCLEHSLLDVAHKGECMDIKFINFQEDTSECDNACLRIYKPICSSNGKTFHNTCHFEYEKCSSNKQMYVAHAGEC